MPARRPRTTPPRPQRLRLPARAVVWVLHMALPVLGLWLFLAVPAADVRWEHHPAHFWLVLAVAGISLLLAVWVAEEARRRSDARLFLLGVAFTAAAGFFTLHALTTPGMLVGPNIGFHSATPVGLLVAAVLAALAALEIDANRSARILARRRWIQGGLAGLLGLWAVVAFAELPPLGLPLAPSDVRRPLVAVAITGAALFAFAAVRFFRLHRRRRSVVLVSVLTACVLLAEALVATVFSRSWQASWWEWHLILVAGFGFVAYSASEQHRREGTRAGLFDSIALEETVQQLHRDHRAALEALVDSLEDRPAGGRQPREAVAAVAHRFGLTERQADVLERAGEALATERSQRRRLAALVDVGQEASVVRREDDLLTRALAITADGFGDVDLQIVVRNNGRTRFLPDGSVELAPAALRQASIDRCRPQMTADRRVLVLPLQVRGRAEGVLEVRRADAPLDDHTEALLRSLASQLSIALENTRLYRQLEELFGSYMSPNVVRAMLADPSQASLGGAIVEVTVLMADLRGFTTFSERSAPDAVVAMLNSYFGAAVPIVLAQDGTVVQFVGDALMALFNAPTRQPDHALRAGRAALAIQQATGRLAARHEGWPRFRVGINTGPALVGNIGSDEFRNYTAIGDTTNLAARLEGLAGDGEVVVGHRTRELLGPRARVRSMGPVKVKGRHEHVEAFVLDGVGDADGS